MEDRLQVGRGGGVAQVDAAGVELVDVVERGLVVGEGDTCGEIASLYNARSHIGRRLIKEWKS